MNLTFTILGCGSSAGVPRPALGWGDCDPNEPKNRRRRCSLLVEQAGPDGITRVLIDTSPDLREQLIDAKVDHLDAVFLTHEHADQTHGMDDLRSFYIRQRARIPCYLNRSTGKDILVRFGYCFHTPPGSNYPPILHERAIEAGDERTVTGKGGEITLQAFLVSHGDIPALGFRIGNVAYSPDVKDIPDESLVAIAGLDLWIIDGLRYTQHPSHFSVKDALSWIQRMQPKHAVITNLHSDLDYNKLGAELPPNVIPAFDGMRLHNDG